MSGDRVSTDGNEIRVRRGVLGGEKKASFPPRLTRSERVLLSICYVALLLAAVYLMEQFCLVHAISWLLVSWVTWCRAFLEQVCSPCVWGTYVVFFLVLAGLIIQRLVCHKISVYKDRLEDLSAIEAMIVEAETVEPRLLNRVKRPETFEQKKKDLDAEVTRLREMGSRGWTEYQVLSLDQMLVDFLKVDDLVAKARLNLAELEEYAEDSACRYDWEQYYRWSNKIEEAIERIEEASRESEQRPRWAVQLIIGGGSYAAGRNLELILDCLEKRE